jgi:hypothetical protein
VNRTVGAHIGVISLSGRSTEGLSEERGNAWVSTAKGAPSDAKGLLPERVVFGASLEKGARG